jgi:hypothetical protein
MIANETHTKNLGQLVMLKSKGNIILYKYIIYKYYNAAGVRVFSIWVQQIKITSYFETEKLQKEACRGVANLN